MGFYPPMARLRKRLIRQSPSKAHYFRVNLTLPEALDRFLEEVGMEAKATRGYKLPKTLIMRALVRMMGELDVDVSGVRSEDELLERLLKAKQK